MVVRKSGRVRKATDEAADDAILRRACLAGVVFRFNTDGRALPVPTEAQLREFWELHSDQLLRDYIRKFPGRRPWAFWQFSIPALGLPEPWFRWDISTRGKIGGVASRDINNPGRYPQSEYLESHNLLSADERAALAAEVERLRGLGARTQARRRELEARGERLGG